ncbi:MAG: GTPase HflX [Lachnospiraceae bacterium]|nr:GTPase HflX [Lachnospiraceae bacterium]
MNYVVIAGLRGDESEEEFEHAIKEMVSLCEACDLEVREIVTQTLLHPDPATYIGSGKARELSDIVRMCDASLVVCLGNLSPAQMKNLQKIIGVSVWDRTNLILEIFSRRARTREAKIQVELAYLQYILPRLSGMWQHLGRQSGGGGSRANKGIGEKQIELDRRQISHQITKLKKELTKIENNRDVQRKGRLKENLPRVALVGYTNAGKSSLMNHFIEMTDAAEAKKDKMVFEKDMLFATLDTSIRRIEVPGRKPFLLSDTVGFIENIPHDLIKAFRSTLAEIKYADVLLIVLDSSDPHHDTHKRVTEDTLRDLDALEIPRIYVYNKSDLRDEGLTTDNRRENESVFVSARTGYGIEDLIERLYEILQSGKRQVDIVIPYSDGELLNRMHREADIISESYDEDGIHIVALCPHHLNVGKGK